ncbi:MAG: hypothetical protein ABIJ21_07700 [Nanoarchaeota archaeon]
MILAIIMAFYMARADMFGSDQCVLKAGFGCKEFEFTRSDIKVNVINSLGKNLQSPITATLECNEKNKFGQNSFTDTFNQPVKNGFNFSFSFAPLESISTRANCRITIDYTEDKYGAYPKSAEGTVRWKKIASQGTTPPEDCGWEGDDDFDGCDDDRDSNCNIKEFGLDGPNSCLDGLDNDCSYAPDCRDDSTGDCCEAEARCSDNTIEGDLANPNEFNEFWCICNDNRATADAHESDMDCGLNCTTYYNKRCNAGQGCQTDNDCLPALICYNGICEEKNCNNDVLNLDESDIISGLGAYNPGGWANDCGGIISTCPQCELLRHCIVNNDCQPTLTCCPCGDPMNDYCGEGGSPIIFKPMPQCDDTC